MADPTSLRTAIRQIADVPSTQTKAFFKRRQMHEVTRKALLDSGYFCQSREGLLYYFDKNKHLLSDMGQQKFKHALSRSTDLSETEAEFRFILNMLQVEAAGTEPIDVGSLAHYDRKTGVIAISNGAGGVYTRQPGGDWELRNNGEDGILFFTDEDSVRFDPDFSSRGSFDWMFDLLLLSDVSTSYGTLTREHQIKFFRMWLYHQFFPSERLTNMVPAFIGRRGSAKTTAMRLIGRLLVGPEWEVSDLRASDKGEEAVIASLCNRIFVGLDNADSEIKWLEEMLARYATGLKFRMRKYYTTNEEVSYRPRAMLAISSRDPHFRREDVAERLGLGGCKRPEDFNPPRGFISLASVLSELDERRNGIWGEILIKIAKIADKLLKVPEAPPMAFRMDLGAFGWRVAFNEESHHEKGWLRILQLQTGYQNQFAAEGDPVIGVMLMLFERQRREIKDFTTAELFKRCREIANDPDNGISDFPASAQSFAQRLANIQQTLETELDAKVKAVRGRSNKLHWWIIGLEHKATIEDMKTLEDERQQVGEPVEMTMPISRASQPE